ncbi:bifunctional DNA primase/polymerase [uncultured Sphingomonas sp.]|uniref:bifunctional DNA primase/polymerase n=1 Tax=uncultured Sphingomonas sp. TaxID=158754 RepID=UPI0025D7DDFF|nr:bifunctional DNA primase/polymerase [uncultured Sphingomonas sp.]
MTQLPSPMCTAALQYARQGWPVFPCREADSEPFTDQKGRTRVMGAKSPYTGKGGLKHATTDERQIMDWWRKWPNALIGLPMGGATRLFALDFDPRHDAETGEEFTLDSLKAALEAQMGCALPISLASRTQSGGVHVFFRQPDAGDPIRNRGNLPEHVDVRGEGGYVIAPPSRMADAAGGGRYRWLEGRQDTKPVDAPANLIEILRAPKARAEQTSADGAEAPATTSSSRPAGGVDAGATAVHRYALSALDAECQTLAATPLGNRNNQCNASGFAVGRIGVERLLDPAAYRANLDRRPVELRSAGAMSLPWSQEITVTATAGYASAAAVPSDLKMAILHMVAHLFTDREGEGAPPAAVTALCSLHRMPWL